KLRLLQWKFLNWQNQFCLFNTTTTTYLTNFTMTKINRLADECTTANSVFLLAGLKFTSERFSLIVHFVIFSKTNYNKPRQQKYPTVSYNFMRKIPIIILFVLIFGFANSQNKQIIETSDIENFWKAFDKLIDASNKNDSINIIQTEYIDISTEFFKEFIKVRNFTAEEYVSLIHK